MNRPIIRNFALVFITLCCASAQFDPTWESVNKHNACPEWFRDAKFGIYFHWGVYSVPAYGTEWYPRWMHITSNDMSRHHVNKYGDLDKFGYHHFIIGANDRNGNWVQFKPQLKSQGGNFDPDEWAQLFKDAGAQFAGPCAEHHDGYSMWDSKVNPWNPKNKVVNMDLVGLFGQAIRNKGMKFITTMHNERTNTFFERRSSWFTASNDPELKKLYCNDGTRDMPQNEFSKYWLDKQIEVIDAYKPDIMWHDTDLDKINESRILEYLAHYFNKGQEWGSEVMVTYKHEDLNQQCAVLDIERGSEPDITGYPWLTDNTITDDLSWSYTNGIRIRSTNSLVDELVKNVSKNGQLLLNCAPKADGSIPQNQQDVLKGIGIWLKTCGEAIYSTRPWLVKGDNNVRFTRNKESTVLYAISLSWPGNNATLNIGVLNRNNFDAGTITGISMLGGSSCTYNQDNSSLKIQCPSSAPTSHAYTFKITFSDKIPLLNDSPVKLYQNNDYGGWAAAFDTGSFTASDISSNGGRDNDASSIKVFFGFKVTLYSGDNFTGDSLIKGANENKLSDDNFNDKVSSLQVEYVPTPVSRPLNQANKKPAVSPNQVIYGRAHVKLYTGENMSLNELTIYDVRGRAVLNLDKSALIAARADNYIIWDLCNSKGVKLGPGIYIAVLKNSAASIVKAMDIIVTFK